MKRLTLILRYILHFLGSNSRHGTHSPFVYALAEQVIYKRGWNTGKATKGYKRLLSEIADHFEVTYTSMPSDHGKDKALWLTNPQISVEELVLWQHQFRYIVLEHIHRSAEDRNRWRSLQGDERFVVTIDLFFFGLVFYRTEQSKQHFKLRYPFWK